MRPARDLTAAQLDARMETLSLQSAEINLQLIAAGRGLDRPSDIRAKHDPLSLRWVTIADACAECHDEAARRRTYSGTLRPIRRQA